MCWAAGERWKWAPWAKFPTLSDRWEDKLHMSRENKWCTISYGCILEAASFACKDFNDVSFIHVLLIYKLHKLVLNKLKWTPPN